ncbi:MAG: TetR/AcrR family transcriptional regulator C-terminal domain-containing protein [Erysipelotrichaceae bacterium]|nr:TetR/AcrR family transcriptional regulator C-terminal domain-containing protein [Erysipelotrichaceae bacterium]
MNTKKMLFQAIEKLVGQKQFSKITVQDILDEAEVSRRTFYKYFHDKYDLANSFYENYVTNQILIHYDGSNWRELLIQICVFILKNQNYFQEINKFQGQGSFLSFLIDYSYHFYSGVYKHNMKIETLSDQDSYRIWYVVGGNIFLLNQWMNKGYVHKPDQMADLLLESMPDIFYRYLD